MGYPLTAYSKSQLLTWPNGLTRFSLSASGFKQKPPYISTSYSATVTKSDSVDFIWFENSFRTACAQRSLALATSKARAELVSEVGETSQFGSTVTTERKQSMQLIENIVLRAWRGARALRRGNVALAALELGISPPAVVVVTKRRRRRATLEQPGKLVVSKRERLVMPTGRKVAKTTAGYWLWYSYGVKPLMGDIHNAVDVFKRPLPEGTKVSGKGFAEIMNNDSHENSYENFYYKSKTFVTMSLTVSLKNADLYLANQLGLVNPVQMFNEGIPFSFIIDWFSNLSQFIQQTTEFIGLSTSDPVTSSRVESTIHVRTKPGKRLSGFRYNHKAYKTEMLRKLEIPAVTLNFNYERFQWQRGANAISLLVGILKDSTSQKRLV